MEWSSAVREACGFQTLLLCIGVEQERHLRIRVEGGDRRLQVDQRGHIIKVELVVLAPLLRDPEILS